MRSEPHPISGFRYQAIGNGRVRVENPATEKYGIFDWKGTWIDGEITHADLHFLAYIGGPDVADGAENCSRVVDMIGGGGLPINYGRVVAKYKGDPGVDTKDGKRSSCHIDLDYFLDNDRKPERVPDVLKRESPLPGGPTRISTDRFIDPRFHSLEIELLWKRVWQMACREDDIPCVGDYLIYNIGHLSYIIVRTGEKEFMAHENACLHRGRILRECDGKAAKEFRCPYHGWSWRMDGTLKEITSAWDFPGVREDVSKLPAAKVQTWGGFVFVNPDPNAGPLEDFLGPVMMDYYKPYELQYRHKSAHVVRVMRANWKITMEAFMEAYHVIATHPQLLLTGSDFNHYRYDVWGHFGRGGPAPNASSPERGIHKSKEDALVLYRATADAIRESLRAVVGSEADQYSDAELNDISFNDVFPNLHPWGGWAEVVFRFRPNGSNHEECVMDVMLLSPWPKDKPKPPAAIPRMLGPNESWCVVPELGSLARVLDQDVGNMASLQAGLRAKQSGYIWYAAYQESKIRNFHRNYDRWLGLP